MNFINWAQLDWPDLAEQPKDDTILRHEQIKLRTAEIEECLRVMGELSDGTCQYSNDSGPTCTFPPLWTQESWKSINIKKPIMAGHSLGGSAAVRRLYAFLSFQD